MPKSECPDLTDQAWEMVERGDLKNARDLFAKIYGLDASNAEAVMMLGTIDGEFGRLEDAINHIETAIGLDPEYADAYLALAKIQFSRGNTDLALKNALKASVLDADYAEAWALLGNIYGSVGAYTDAESSSRRAIALNQGLADGHVGLANVFTHQGKFEDAEKCYGTAIQLQPRDPTAHYMRSKIQLHLGNETQAEISAQAAIAVNPHYADAHLLLGFIQSTRGQTDKATISYQRVLEISPDNWEAHLCLGRLLQATGNVDSALSHYENTVQLCPENAEAHALIGMLHIQKDKLAEAASSINRAIELQPDLQIALFHRGLLDYKNGNLQEAAANFRRVLETDANNMEALLNLALVLQDTFKLDETRKIYERILNLMDSTPQPGLRDEKISSVYYNYAKILGSQGLPDESIASYRKALIAKPDFALAGSCILHALHNSPTADPGEIFAEHLQWTRNHIGANQSERSRKVIFSSRRLRIGYVSPDFKKHSVAYYFEALLRNHDSSKFEIFCYSDTTEPDEITERFKNLAHHWHTTSHMTAEELATLITGDEIDILVDLAGHTKDNRLQVFARRPAPVQMTYLGYPDTTGLTTMDYRITDERTDPSGEGDDLNSETLIRLPRPFLCYTPPENTPKTVSPPMQEKGYITFGSLNSLTKINSSVVETWARILKRVPGSHLLLKNFFLEDAGTREQYFERFQNHGIERERLELFGPTAETADHLDYYNRIDIALDTFPYNGTTTTCEALWMSVPVIAVQGNRHAGRVGSSILQELDLDDLVADDYDEYINKACDLSENKKRLEELRGSLRDRFSQSRLCNGKDLAQAIEEAYANSWKLIAAG